MTLFHKYERGEWTIESIIEGTLEISRRRHQLSFVYDDQFFQTNWLAVIRHVNEDQFLEIDPGFLFCEGAWVSIVNPSTDSSHIKEMERVVKQTFWLLRYDFIEQFPQGWNEIMHPATAGKYERRHHSICLPANMTAFFGANMFPLSK